MTHGELLAKIDGDLSITGYQFRDTLRAVVELHKPISFPSTSGLPLECSVCRAEPYYSTNEVYPCPTIRVIEKELV